MADAMNAAVRGNSSKVTWGSLHLLGSATSSVALGLLLGGLGALLGASWQPQAAFVVLTIALLYVAREMFHLQIPIPEARRQVPSWWQSFFTPPVTAFLYGSGLGIGFATYLGYGTLAVVAVAAVASGSPLTGAIVMGTFGIARAAAVIWVASRRAAPDLERVGRGTLVGRLNVAALALVALAAAPIWH